jgi:hypothetical protein
MDPAMQENWIIRYVYKRKCTFGFKVFAIKEVLLCYDQTKNAEYDADLEKKRRLDWTFLPLGERRVDL